MPLRDHFHLPVRRRVPWPSIHSGWIAELTGRLNELMPPGYLALDTVRFRGGLEIDVGAVEGEETPGGSSGTNGGSGGGTAVATAQAVYTPPAATGTAPFDYPEIAEVRVFSDPEGRQLVGAVEMVSPGNKDRGVKREAFIGKCLDILASGASLVIVDVVTDRHANLHNEIVRKFDGPLSLEMPGDANLYAAAYRPVTRGKKTEIDVWMNPLRVGDSLPTMPLRLIADYFVPVELEATYTEACRRRRLV